MDYFKVSLPGRSGMASLRTAIVPKKAILSRPMPAQLSG
jgi:hypothetical protein